MKDTKEEIIQRVLHGLCDAAPPDGMESRIVNAVRHRATSMPIPVRLPWRTASVFGGAVLASVACALFFTAHRKLPQAPLSRLQAVSMQARNGIVTPATAAKQKPVRSTRRRTLVATTLPSGKELTTISYPAPPMPLTEQERLLLQLAHHGDPVQLAMLDTVQRNARYAEERAEVQRFFTPSTPGENK